MRRPSLVIAFALAVALLASCSSGPGGVARTGLVTVPLSDDIVGSYGDVDRATDPLEAPSLWEGELAVLGAGLPPAERVVVRLEAPGAALAPWERSFEPAFALPDGRPARYGLAPTPITCSSQQLSVQLAGGARLLVSGVGPVARQTLQEVATHVGVRDLGLDLRGLPSRFRPVGTLPRRWVHGGDGTRVVDGLGTRLVRRVSDADRPVLLALRCADPVRSISPPPSQTPDVLQGREPTTRTVQGQRYQVGLLGVGAIAVGDDVVLLWEPPCCGVPPRPGAIAAAVAGVEVVSADELRRTDGRLRANRVRVAASPRHPLASGRDGDVAWQLRRLAGSVCLDANFVGRYPAFESTSTCIPDEPAGSAIVLPATSGAGVSVLLGAVGPGVDRVEVHHGADPVHVVPVHDVPGTRLGHAFVAVLAPSVQGFGPLDSPLPQAEVQLWGGPLVVRAIGRDGGVVATATYGRA
ncbi:MAG: hypothetical protein JWN67_912 [Actinomycetia bacterium]|nr:hypothetical protein [Actinomycetes bacterium]